MADTAFAPALAELTAADRTSDPALAGPYFESYVMQQLRPQVDGIRGALTHVRTGSGEHEVDAVIETGHRHVIGVEVKLGVRPSSADARRLGWLRDQLGDLFAHGFVVHTGGDSCPLGDRIWALPVSVLTSPAG